jgi:acylphosphatase
MRRVDVSVRGRVQGVFFRASTQEKAVELGIRGTVRNEPDGSVFIEAEGNDEELEQFLAWVRKGPPHARVDSVKVREGDLASFPEFRIVGR